MVTLISGFLASNFLTRSVMTSPSLPSEYQVMRNWVCALADDCHETSDPAMAAAKTQSDTSLRTVINPSRICLQRQTCFLLTLWAHLRVERGDNQYARRGMHPD